MGFGERETEWDNKIVSGSGCIFGSVGCDGKAIIASTVSGLLHRQ